MSLCINLSSLFCVLSIYIITLPVLSATIKNRSPKNLFLVAKDDKAVERPIFDENMKVNASSCRIFQQGKVWKKILKEWPGYWSHQYLEITEMNYVINGLTEATLIFRRYFVASAKHFMELLDV